MDVALTSMSRTSFVLEEDKLAVTVSSVPDEVMARVRRWVLNHPGLRMPIDGGNLRHFLLGDLPLSKGPSRRVDGPVTGPRLEVTYRLRDDMHLRAYVRGVMDEKAVDEAVYLRLFNTFPPGSA